MVGLYMVLFNCIGYGQRDTLYSEKFDWVTGVREPLPEWILLPQGKERVTGVSDPGLKPEIAREQAIQRALFLYVLSQGVDVLLMTDYFKVGRNIRDYESLRDKLITMAQVNGTILPLAYHTGREYYTRYGEAFVEVFPDSLLLPGLPGKIRGDLMLVNEGALREKKDIRSEWEIQTPELEIVRKSVTVYKGNCEYSQVERSVNDCPIFAEKERYWYRDSENKPPEMADGCKLNYSFWCAQIESLLYAIVSYAFPEVCLKNLEEDYGTVRQELKREIIREKIALRVENMRVEDNKLWVQWKVTDGKNE